jgi:MFS superfamily sulfate permease-like transporter
LFVDFLVQPHMWGQSVQVALIASAETLLCAVAVDRMHNGPRTKFDRELLAQGIGNTICGLLGALPMTGVIVRSSANVDAGARTRLSTILHGAWLLVMVALLPFVLELIPIASLAAILVVTGIKLVWTDAPKKLFAQSKAELAVFCATLVVIVAKDLLTGVVFGLGLAVALLVHRFAQMAIEVQPTADGARVRLVGNATFLRLPQLATALASIPRHAVLYLDLTELDYLDPACSEVIEDWRAEAKRVGGTLVTDEASLAGRKRRAGPAPSMDGAVADAGDNA